MTALRSEVMQANAALLIEVNFCCFSGTEDAADGYVFRT